VANQNETISNVVGKPEDRVDGRLKVTGEAKYSAEMPVPGALHAVMVMSTIAKGQIESMDTSAALQQPGVRTVLTPFNAPKIGKEDNQSGKGSPQDRVLSVLQNTNVFYQNQPIALVVADTLESAEYGASLVKVKYHQEKPVLDMDKERQNAYTPKKANRDKTDSLRGDPETGFNSASTKLDQVYRTPFEHHNPMEPHAIIAIWDTPDQLTVYDATQGIFGVQGVLARAWNIPPANVRCKSYFVGGGFGCKGSPWSHVVLSTLAAKVTGTPVKLVLSRRQMFGMVGYRPETEQSIKIGSNAGGNLSAIRHDVLTQTSSFDEFIEPSAVATRMLYSCPNVGTTHRVARLDLGTPTYMRAPGESSGTFAIETAMDEVATTLKMDPIEFRNINYAIINEDEKKPFSSKSLKQCYEIGAARFGWEHRPQQPGSSRTDDGMLIGFGVATATYPANRSPASASAKIMPDGSAVVSAGTQDIGTGTYTVMRQIAAQEMGLPYDQVTFLLGDTKMPQTPVSGGSQTAASTGSAVLAVGQAAKAKVIDIASNDPASPVYGLKPEQVTVQNGRIFAVSDSNHAETVADLIKRQKLPSIDALASSAPGPEHDQYAMHSFGAIFTEVHVDPDFGTVKVARAVGVYGVGNRLNAKTARSQLIGGMVFGIGMAMMEETHVDRRSGRIVNADLAEYHVPVNADVPAIEVIFVDEEDKLVNPLGIKGIGEIGITGIVASLGNAIYNATGVRVRDIPFTLDKIIS
jgi:xanthine dehydrogenase YagR molybdenum-binding subunit